MNAITTRQSAGFALQPGNLTEAMQMAEMLSHSQMVPKSYQNKPQDTLVAMMMGAELGLNPIQSLQNIAVVNGRPSIYGDALLALVMNHPAFGGHEESFDQNTMTATCTVWRKGDQGKHSVSYSMEDAKQAGLWEKQGPWKQYPKRMLMWRARGYALRDKFADALGGLITVEEAQDMPTEREINPRSVQAAESQPSLQHYPVEDFETNFPKWQQLIEAGRRTPEQIISMVSTKGVLTDEQKMMIEGAAA
ncbi:recombinase RecT [Marinobacterium jannaschii]|uniref:recombinase RecT n=1 Tax=Marinobacterium jannaschii TaxID=64970 RepID=UPI00056A04A7|nr:recombinase RecT [Marinobacterium jannaschii]